MFKLTSEFYRLPLRFDPSKLAEEVLQFREEEWRAHPAGHAGNTALPLVSVDGGINDAVKGPMRPTAFLERCPYLQQALAALGTVIGRARLMRIAGQSDATEHVDTNYYWMHHVRVHIPAVTYPEVRFLCERKSVHMAAGEAWIFDSWKRHNVLNPVTSPRIHLVADTVGSAHFWDLVERGERPCDPSAPSGESPCHVPFQPGAKPEIEFEEENYPLVMSPFEQESLGKRMMDTLSREGRESPQGCQTQRLLDRLHQQWHALWTRFGDPAGGLAVFQRTIAEFDRQLPQLAGTLTLINEVPLVEALRQAIVRPAVNLEIAKWRQPAGASSPVAQESTGHAASPRNGAAAAIHAPAATRRATPDSAGALPTIPPFAPASATIAPAASSARITRPVFIVSAPRSGSSVLFELLGRSPDAWTIGGESHALFEDIAPLHPKQRGWDSNRLSAAEATPEVVQQIHRSFLRELRDRDGRALPANATAVRLLEKTPKNALRVPFLAQAFPDALFIYLTRDSRENISSMLDAWKSGQFVTYPRLPGWHATTEGTPAWSLLLVPGWRDLIGKPLAEIVVRQWTTANTVLLDDLAALPPERWCPVSYEDLVRDPQGTAAALCAFAGWRWDQQVQQPLPLSRHTLTPPVPDKWRKNEAELAPFLPFAAATATRSRATLARPSTRTAMPNPAPAMTPTPSSAEPEPLSFDSEHTASFPVLLSELGISLAVSTYQAGKLILLRAQDGLLNTHFRDFYSPMGIAVAPGRLAIGARHDVWHFRAFAPSAITDDSLAACDTLYLPSGRLTTGDIRIHEIAWGTNELWAVNTRFSCLCTFDGFHNFIPRWKPPFISHLTADDRCHLNGLAMIEGEPAYVTCHGTTDGKEGWRNTKANGGVLVEVNGGEIVASGLSMPHSPRFYDGRVWLLESGHGRLSVVDLDSGKVEPFVELPGFTRGLDFYGPYAFIGTSQVRESAVFSGIAIASPDRERHCGVWVVDLRTAQVVAFVRFSGSVEEIFSVQVLPGARFPDVITDENHDVVGGSFLLPPEVAASAQAGLQLEPV